MTESDKFRFQYSLHYMLLILLNDHFFYLWGGIIKYLSYRLVLKIKYDSINTVLLIKLIKCLWFPAVVFSKMQITKKITTHSFWFSNVKWIQCLYWWLVLYNLFNYMAQHIPIIYTGFLHHRLYKIQQLSTVILYFCNIYYHIFTSFFLIHETIYLSK